MRSRVLPQSLLSVDANYLPIAITNRYSDSYSNKKKLKTVVFKTRNFTTAKHKQYQAFPPDRRHKEKQNQS